MYYSFQYLFILGSSHKDMSKSYNSGVGHYVLSAHAPRCW